jgi:hypothetical protein
LRDAVGAEAANWLLKQPDAARDEAGDPRHRSTLSSFSDTVPFLFFLLPYVWTSIFISFASLVSAPFEWKIRDQSLAFLGGACS